MCRCIDALCTGPAARGGPRPALLVRAPFGQHGGRVWHHGLQGRWGKAEGGCGENAVGHNLCAIAYSARPRPRRAGRQGSEGGGSARRSPTQHVASPGAMGTQQQHAPTYPAPPRPPAWQTPVAAFSGAAPPGPSPVRREPPPCRPPSWPRAPGPSPASLRWPRPRWKPRRRLGRSSYPHRLTRCPPRPGCAGGAPPPARPGSFWPPTAPRPPAVLRKQHGPWPQRARRASRPSHRATQGSRRRRAVAEGQSPRPLSPLLRRGGWLRAPCGPGRTPVLRGAAACARMQWPRSTPRT